MDNGLVLRSFTPARTGVRGLGARPLTGPAIVQPFQPAREPWPHSVAPSFERDVLSGLARAQKAIPSTWLYDHRGSELFEQITHLDQYYPTRSELRILRSCAGEIADAAGPRAIVIELGSGSSRKTRLLLDALDTPQALSLIHI